MVKSTLLLAVLAVGFVLRIVGIANIPPGFNQDEAAFGYNAYSLLLTGRDEWGTPFYRLPFTNLRSFGDYKLPLYAFLAVPSVKILGLNEFAVRLPNAVIGTLAIAAVYYFSKKIFDNLNIDNSFQISNFKLKIEDIASLLLAISPWSVSLSRGAFEANLVTLFFPLAAYLFLSRRYTLAALFFALNFYSYHSARFLTPVFVIMLLIFKPPARPNRTVFLILLFLFTLPGLFSLTGAGARRAADVGIFSPTDDWQAVSQDRFRSVLSGVPDPLSRLFHNKLFYLADVYVRNYLGYFSPQFLFSSGPAESGYGMMPGFGVLSWISLPLLMAFIIYLVKNPGPSILLLAFLLASPLPAALSKGGGYSANRAAVMIPFLMISCAYGFFFLVRAAGRFRQWISLALLSSAFVFSAFYLESYFFLSPFRIGTSMFAGMRELVDRSVSISREFPVVRVGRSISEPHIFFAFYQALDPRQYQQASRDWLVFEDKGLKYLDQYDGYSLGKFRFGDLKNSEPVSQPTLYIGRAEDFPSDYPYYFRLDSLNGQPEYQVSRRDPS